MNGQGYTGYKLSRSIKDYKIYGFYKIKYQKNDPKNFIILLDKNRRPLEKLSIEKLLENTIKVKGEINKILKYRDDYYDLTISYNYKNCNYTFISRLKISDLPYNDIQRSKVSGIDILVSSIHPIINNIYFKSITRSKKRSKINVTNDCG